VGGSSCKQIKINGDYVPSQSKESSAMINRKNAFGSIYSNFDFERAIRHACESRLEENSEKGL